VDLVRDPIAVGALGELIATAVAAAAGGTWKTLRAKPEARAMKSAVSAALTLALRDAVLPPDRPADDEWVAEVAQVWLPAFNPPVSSVLVDCLADPSSASVDRFARLARTALVDAGCDIAALERTFWVEEFLAALPRRLFSSLSEASLRDSSLRSLVDHLLRQRGDARASEGAVASPGEFRRDVIALSHRLDTVACTERLPAYLPTDMDVPTLSRPVRVRQGIRNDPARNRTSIYSRNDDLGGGSYHLLAESSQTAGPLLLWPEAAAKYRRLVVLGDPGMGKSWLIRTETHRLAREALASSQSDLRGGLIPVPMRCDQLADASGQDLADKVAGYLVAQDLLPVRAQAGLAAKVRTGEVVLLLDALDELTTAQSGLLRTQLQTWAAHAGDRARCVITSRIAGYTGSPVPGATEVELLAFNDADAVATVEAWHMPPAVAAQLVDRARDPAVATMAHVPLLLALICSLAVRATGNDELPRTRGQLFDRVLRWFLTREHRSPDDPTTPLLADIDVDGLLEILAPLAFTFATEPAGWIDLMPGERLLDVIRAVGPAFTERRRPAAEVLRELSVEAGVLVPAGDPSAGRSPGYLFFHRAVAEYLVARHLSALPKTDWLAIVEQHRWFDPEWAEVIPMLGERLSPAAATQLLEYLLTADADPFYHSLLMASRVWGARPDADQILSAGQSGELTGQLVKLIRHRVTRPAVTSRLTAMGYMPRPLLTGLLGLLDDQDERVRWAIIQALAGREGPDVTESLLGLLGDRVYEVRQAAAEALAGHESPDITIGMLERLRHPDGNVRRDTATALAGREGHAVTEGLLGVLGDWDTRVGRAAAQALAQRDTPGLTEALLDLLDNTDERIRLAAVEALAVREGHNVTEALIDLLDDPDFLICDAAAQALAGRDGQNVTEALIGLLDDQHIFVGRHLVHKLRSRKGQEVTAALVGLLDASDFFTPFEAARALASRNEPNLTEQLIHLIGDPDWGGRAGAARVLAGRDGQSVTDVLVSMLRDPEGSVRQEATKALAGRDGQNVTEALISMLSDPEDNVRWEAAQALAGRDGQNVTEALLRLLGDPGIGVRRAAVEALTGREEQNVTEALISMLSDPEDNVRWEAAEALANRTSPEVTVALVEALNDPFSGVQEEAARALAGREGPGITQGLLSLLSDPEPLIRTAAADVLAGRDGPEVTEALLDLLDDPDESVRWAGVDALVGREDAAKAFLALASDTSRLVLKDWAPVINLAERLMIRCYRQLQPVARSEIRAVMARLTATALAVDAG
jgi:HEAT repeat protein